jgi:hypothetical protein
MFTKLPTAKLIGHAISIPCPLRSILYHRYLAQLVQWPYLPDLVLEERAKKRRLVDICTMKLTYLPMTTIPSQTRMIRIVFTKLDPIEDIETLQEIVRSHRERIESK